MPIYDYECSACHHRFEIKQSFSDAAISVCPKCAGLTRRVLYPAGIIFKGSGWHVNDYGRGRVPNGDADHDHDNGESKSESKTESTPATPSTNGSAEKSTSTESASASSSA